MARLLTPEIDEKISTLCKVGDELAHESHYHEAKDKYIEALSLLPDNPTEFEASTWIYAAMGDAYFYLKNYDKMLECFRNVLNCPNGHDNPFIHLRLGQAYFELNDLDRAAEQLTKAYLEAGTDIFMEDDPKYLAFLETQIELY